MLDSEVEALKKWRTEDIIYVAIVGPVMAAAALEWFLWISAFIYGLYKVYVKADHWSVKVLAVIMAVAFTALRAIFLPVMVVTLPLPYTITRHFPPDLVSFLQWFAFWTFAVLLIVPWLFCVYRLVTNSLGRTKQIKEVLDDRTAPKTVIVMPVYKEDPPVLIKAIDSVVDCDYPPSCIHVFLSYDGEEVDESYLQVAGHLGIPISLTNYPPSIDVTYKRARITLSRFPHGGKRHCQKQTFRLIDKVYAEYLKKNDNLFLLFIDSDCILDRVCLQNFMYDMELKPGSKQNMLAMTGVITSTTQKNTLITLLQDMEYVHGQLFERSVESGCGAVTCLPGALTVLRFSAFRKMAKHYFADKAEQCEDLFDFGKNHLGEDRWLTHLFMIGAKKRYQIQMCTSAFCKTEAVQTFASLLKQRRRWFLGFITNEVCMLTDARIWRKYPLLCIVRFMQNTIRTTALLFFIMVISVITTSNKVQNLPVGFIAVSLGLNYLLMFYFGAKLRRFKAWLYPLMFVLNPFFNWLYMVYGIFTAGQRTWGGPRADAAGANDATTPSQAADEAEAKGDELNVDFHTFRPAGQDASSQQPIPVQPSQRVEGRFAAPELDAQGYYTYASGSGVTLAAGADPNLPTPSRLPLHRHGSFDSEMSFDSTGNNSIVWPRRVESIVGADAQVPQQVFMGEEDQRKVYLARQWGKESSSGGVRQFELPPSDSRPGSPALSEKRSLSHGRPASRGPSPSAERTEPADQSQVQVQTQVQVPAPLARSSPRSSLARSSYSAAEQPQGQAQQTRATTGGGAGPAVIDMPSSGAEQTASESEDGQEGEHRGRRRKRLTKKPRGRDMV